jgi:hypothetical protein
MVNEVEAKVEHRAVAFVTRYYEAKGWKVENVSKARGTHGGYDLFATNGHESLKIEVKGCTRPFGIPDPYHTEFDKDTRLLIADVLCVVYYLPGTVSPQLAIIPRDAILAEHVTPKHGYPISSKFKNARSITPFFVDL